MPVSITGTVDSVTTVWIRPAPPRGMTRSTSPRAVISARAASWPPPSSRHDRVVGEAVPAAQRPAHDVDQRPVGRRRCRAAAQDHGVAALEGEARGVDGDVGPRLVDHADDAHRHPDLADLQTVGQRRPAHHLSHGVGQSGDVAHRLGDRADPPLVEREPVEQPLGQTVLTAPLEVLGVGGDDLVGGRDEGVGDRVQRVVLGRPRQQRELSRGPAGPFSERVHLLDRGGVDRLGGHAPRVRRDGGAPPRGSGGRSPCGDVGVALTEQAHRQTFMRL